MKTVEFHGKTYQVPGDAMYITYDYSGDVKVSNHVMQRRYSDWAELDHGGYLDDRQWVIKIDNRKDLDKSLWHGSLTKV